MDILEKLTNPSCPSGQAALKKMDLSLLIQQTVDQLLPHLSTKDKVAAIDTSLAELDGPAPLLWKQLRTILIEEFEVNGKLDEGLTNPAILKHVVRKSLKKDDHLRRQLEDLLGGKISTKNEIRDSAIEAGKDLQIGDEGQVNTTNIDHKNTVFGSTIKAGGNIYIGDRIEGSKQNADGSEAQSDQALRDELAQLPIEEVTEVVNQTHDLVAKGKIKAAIDLLTQFSKQGRFQLLRNELTGLSSRYEVHLANSRQGVMSIEEDQRGKNRITKDLLELLQYFPS